MTLSKPFFKKKTITASASTLVSFYSEDYSTQEYICVIAIDFKLTPIGQKKKDMSPATEFQLRTEFQGFFCA